MSDELLIAVLAAGASRRLGQPKQLVEVGGEAVVARQCRVAIAASLGPVVAVLGCQRDRVASALRGLNLKLIINDAWEEGMAASVRAAARAAIAADAAAILLFHCDQYAITAADLIRLHRAWAGSPNRASLSRDGEYLGPPALLPARLFHSMLALEGDTGPRAILRSEARVDEVIMPSARLDIDLPADLAGVRARENSTC